MTVRATVLIPTHDHGPLLRLAAASALTQTIADIEVLIVLDGADEPTRSVAAEVAGGDDRVRLLDFPKGERHGEAHRDEALAGAAGRIVCYLSDDDLWFPDHLEYLETLLSEADFAHSTPIRVAVDGSIEMPYLGDVSERWFRDEIDTRHNFIPLSTGGHTLDAYRRLPVGWAPAPPDIPTDAHMWRKFAAMPDMRFATGGWPTVVNMPSARRRDLGMDQRVAEMERLWERLRHPEALRRDALEALVSRAAALTRDERTARRRSNRLRRQRDRLRRRLRATRRRLEATEGSTALRAARRIGRIPVLGSLARWIGRLLAPRR